MSSGTLKMCLGNSYTLSVCSEGITARLRCSNRNMSFTYFGGVYYRAYGSSGYTLSFPIN